MSYFFRDTMCKYLVLIEQSVDVNKYRQGHIHVWPLLRGIITRTFSNLHNVQLYEQHSAKTNIQEIVETINQRFENIEPTLKKSDELSSENDFSEDNSQRKNLETSSVCIIGRNDDYGMRLTTGWFAPIVDSWYDYIGRKCKCPVIKAEILEGQATLDLHPRVFPSLLIHPQFNPAKLKHQTLYDNLKKQLALLLADIHKFSLGELKVDFELGSFQKPVEILLQSSLSVRNSVKPFLRDLRPTAVMMSCSYYYLGYGVHWAASDLSICGIELHHGALTDNNPSYTHLTSLPKSGYCMIPKIQNVWGRAGAKRIFEWFPDGHEYHQVIVGGKVRYRHIVDRHIGESKLTPFKELTASYGKVILLSLQPYEHLGLTPELVFSMLKSPDDWLWLIRCHPLANRPGRNGFSPQKVHDMLNSRNFKRYETDFSTSLPLEIILSFCDHNVTHLSSACLDAMAEGVPTTCVHPAAQYLYSAEIETGCISLALENQQILDSIKKFRTNPLWHELAKNYVDTDEATRDNFMRHVGLV